MLRITRKTFLQLRGRGILGTAIDAFVNARRIAYSLLLRLPGVRDKVRLEIDQGILKIERKLVPSGPGVERYLKLPQEGWSHDKVKEELGKLVEMKHTRWEDGRVSGAVYHGGRKLSKLQTEAFEMFTVANPIHPDVFPGVRKMEAEIVAMVGHIASPVRMTFAKNSETQVLSLFNAPEGAAGVTTSGGTESILMACLSARQKAYYERGVTEPEMICPDTAHAAFLKAGEYFRIKIHLAPCKAPTYKVHIPSVSRLINSNTVLIVGSAPNYPHGIIDDISALSRLALRNKIPLHVDCCLGSFVVACLDKAGFASEPFDFRLKGVTSISCDTHKYGFAPKGNSTVLYRDRRLRAFQYFVTPNWPGGVYASPAVAGSRPGALIAGCWASMMAQGENGYVDACHRVVGTAKRLEAAIREDPELCADLEVVGRPLVSVVAFTSPTLDIYNVADTMSEKGWHLNALQNPPAMHVAVTLPLVAAVDQLIADLKTAVKEVSEKERKEKLEGKGKGKGKKGDASALYGVAGSLPDKTVVKELAKAYLDTLYKA